MIVTPAWATTLVTTWSPSPPLPQGVNRLKNPPPPDVIVSVIGYVPLELSLFMRCCVETLSRRPCLGEALSIKRFLTSDSFCFSFLEIFREVWSSEPYSQGNIHRHQHGWLIECRYSIRRHQHRRLIVCIILDSKHF